MFLKVHVVAFCISTAVCTVATPASAQMTPLAKLNCTTDNFPNCGWGPRPENQYHRRTLLVGAGPQGQNVAQFEFIPASARGQYYFGWSTGVADSVSQGAVRYMRVRMRLLSPLNATGVWGGKFIILGDGGDEITRVIANLAPRIGLNDIHVDIARNIDGTQNGTAPYNLPLGQWNNLQFEARSARTTGSGDGRIRMWVNNNAVNSPTAQSGSMQLNVSTWQNIAVGYYADSLGTGGNVTLQIADFEFDDEFDPNWNAAPGGGPIVPPPGNRPPAPPTDVRILDGSLGLIPTCVLLAGRRLLRRRRSDS